MPKRAEWWKPANICLTRLFPGTRGVGRGGKSREPQRVGASESFASTTDANTSFATPSTTTPTIADIWRSKTCGDSE